MKKFIIKYSILFLAGLSLGSCESFVEIAPPKTESVSLTIYSTDATAIAAVRGIYHEMVLSGFANGSPSSVTFLSGASADEFISYTSTIDEFYNNNILPTSGTNSNLWVSAYKSIYYCNSVIEGLQGSTTITASLKTSLTGEAKFIRAFSHFYLINLYGDVPLLLTTDYKMNAVAKRNSRDELIARIIQDLSEASTALPIDFQFSGSERVRVTAWAATALLARVYLYTNDFVKAESYSTSVINQNVLFKIVTDLNGVFLKNSSEAIWQLMPVTPGQNTYEGAFVPASPTSLPSFVSLTNTLFSAFESGDKRKTNWTGSQTVGSTVINYPFKYKVSKLNLPVTEYSMVLRLAEQYLIRAEARARQGKFVEAMNDIDVIRTRAGLASIQTKILSPTMDNMMAAIEQERKVELFSEWGHRWLDLKRWDRASAVLQPVKINWSSSDMLYPVPQSEIASNPNLNPQNPGY